MTKTDRIFKRSFDFVFAFCLFIPAFPIILVTAGLAAISTGSNGFFRQSRIGLDGRPFMLFKIRTMRNVAGVTTNVTTRNDVRITPFGEILRRTKLDELPQLINILLGHMSFVGPRPDVPGYADQLKGADRRMLSIRPGVTGPATLKYRNEEELLATVTDPEAYNDNVLWPDKVRINLEYIDNYSFSNDISYIWQTITGK